MKLIQKIYRKIKYIKWRENDKGRVSEILDLSKSGSKHIYLLGTPEYLNYGDHLIAEGEKNFLIEKFPSYEVIEITKELLILHFEEVVQDIKDTDIIAITGGGFWGDLYPDMEKLMEALLERLQDNLIIFLPATIYLSQAVQNLNGEYELFKKINNLKNAIFFAREMNTYNLLKDKCSNKNVEIHFSPDIALYYKYNSNMCSQGKVGVCIRKDKEAVVNFDENYLNVISKNKIQYFSTVKSNSFLNPKSRVNKINDFLDMISSYEYVITDRLHCMIMCYITHTPCIVFDNLTKKISGVFCWIKNTEFIKLVTNFDEFKKAIEKIQSNKFKLEDNDDLENKFLIIANEIQRIIDFTEEKNEPR